jgi:hypothetical protein
VSRITSVSYDLKYFPGNYCEREVQEAGVSMHTIRRLTACIAAGLIAIGGVSAPCWAAKPDEAFANDPSITIRYVPGKYYEYRAQLAVKDKKFAESLEMFQKAAYWGNKIAQYNVGMLYLNGADGVPIDKVRGTAWLGIAAETHQAYVDKALGQAYATLSADERAAAGKLWQQLRADYDDKVTLPRANRKFNDELIRAKGSITGPPEYTTITFCGAFGCGGGAAEHPLFDSGGLMQSGIAQTTTTVNAAKFLTAVKDQYDDYINLEFGRVTVGEPESLGDYERDAAQHAKK